jgi:putative FmdB family regulatory protein
MPIYEYRCQSCGLELEKLQKISDPVLVECPECGKESLVKLVSASSFRLKGGGWYESDFKTGKKKNGVGEADNASSSDKTSTAAEGASASKEDASSPKKEDAAKPEKSSANSKPGGTGNQSASS